MKRRKLIIILGKEISNIFIVSAPLYKVFGGIAYIPNEEDGLCEDTKFMKKWNILAQGQVLWDPYNKSFHGRSPFVPRSQRGKGLGKLLYKGMLLASKKMTKKFRLGRVKFNSEDMLDIASTSPSASRVYKSLERLNYLKKKTNEKPVECGCWPKNECDCECLYIINKLPRNLKPIYLNGESKI